jgi:hypothetical protein
VTRLVPVSPRFEALPALGFLLIPVPTMLTLAGVYLFPSRHAFARVLGSALFAFCVLLWIARRSGSAEVARDAVACMLTYYAVSAVVLLLAQRSGQMVLTGWAMVLAHSALSVWCGYALLKR